MNEKLVITSLFNCGVLLKTADITILVDGINRDTEYYSGITERAFHDLINREEPFGTVDYLLFTHAHADHCDWDKLMEYLRKNRIKGIFAPLGDSSPSDGFWGEDIPSFVMIAADGARGHWRFNNGEGALTYFATSHLTPASPTVDHYALLLDIQGKRIYFSGDSDFRTSEQQEALRGIGVDVAFFTPFYLNMSAGRNIIKSINARHNFIYHLPPETKDCFSIRKRADRDLKKYREDLPEIKLILKPMETCCMQV